MSLEEFQELLGGEGAAVVGDERGLVRIVAFTGLLDDQLGLEGGSLGVDAEGAWKEVMRSNFDKVDPRTGRVNKREDGKVLKPANWEPPRLERFVRPE